MLSQFDRHHPDGSSGRHDGSRRLARRANANEQPRGAQKIGWRDGCLLDIVSPRATAPLMCGAEGGMRWSK